ncbi:MAG: hypothetical protein MJ203_03725 [archaeon]|nr:hypothetical protein [archaeon]
MIEHHIKIAEMLKERLEAKESKEAESVIEPVETVKLEDIAEEDFSFKTADKSEFKFIDEDY